MVKKLTALLLAMLLTASMTACGNQDDAQAGGGVAPGTEDTAGGAVQPPAQETDAPDQGAVNGGTYTNHLAGISCTLDDSWVFYTQEEIDTLSALLSDGADSEALQQRLAENTPVRDMYAVSTDGLMTIAVSFENLGLLNGKTVTAQETTEATAEQLPALWEEYGLTDVAAQLTAVDFAGQKSVPAVAVSAKNQDVPMYELLICLKADNYLYTVTLCSFTEDVTADMAALFTTAA